MVLACDDTARLAPEGKKTHLSAYLSVHIYHKDVRVVSIKLEPGDTSLILGNLSLKTGSRGKLLV